MFHIIINNAEIEVFKDNGQSARAPSLLHVLFLPSFAKSTSGNFPVFDACQDSH